ncbi:uncharacterized protein LTHEOB_4547 [Neofusicoccum parvum]|nr:uncharacterized protein LTHEOB_4547 [Neofusicoccum parvum]
MEGSDPAGEMAEHLVFTNAPSIAALHCTPIIETALADVTVDHKTGEVQYYRISGKPETATEAWTDDVLVYPYSSQEYYPLVFSANTTTSYGSLFVRSLLAAAHITIISVANDISGYGAENLNDNTFTFRDRAQGLNLDYMTYAMYALADKDPTALLNTTTMERLAQRTFSTFFQHFASSNVPMDTGGWAYQTINASLPPEIAEQRSKMLNLSDVPVSQTNRTAVVRVDTRAEMLNMSPVAVWLSVGILAWLIMTTIIIAAVQRRYLKNLDRNIECVGDVLVLIAGSEKLLQLVRERGTEGLREDRNIKTKLGWFENSHGESRGGIEIVNLEAGTDRSVEAE